MRTERPREGKDNGPSDATPTLPQAAPNRRLLAVGAHPDDVEYYCGGTVAALSRQGWHIEVVICTEGDKGLPWAVEGASPDTVRTTRRAEARLGLGILRGHALRILPYPDGELEANKASLVRELARVYRECRPHLLLTFDPWKRYELHPDHRTLGLAALDARLAAKLPLYFPEFLQAGLEPWAVKEVWLFNTDELNHFVDITQTINVKLEALAKHASQFGPIWEETASEMVKQASAVGQRMGVSYAEGFHRILIPGVQVTSRE